MNQNENKTRDIISWEGYLIDLNSIIGIEPPLLFTSESGALGKSCTIIKIHMGAGTLTVTKYFDILDLPYRMHDAKGNLLEDIQWKYADHSWHEVSDTYTKDKQLKVISDAWESLQPLLDEWNNHKQIRCITNNVT
jgi:hypothetical protein